MNDEIMNVDRHEKSLSTPALDGGCVYDGQAGSEVSFPRKSFLNSYKSRWGDKYSADHRVPKVAGGSCGGCAYGTSINPPKIVSGSADDVSVALSVITVDSKNTTNTENTAKRQTNISLFRTALGLLVRK